MRDGRGLLDHVPPLVRLAWLRLLAHQRLDCVHKRLKPHLRAHHPKSAPGWHWVMLQLEPGPHFQLA